MTWTDRILRFLRVPTAPSAPAGDQNVEVFRASSKYFNYRLVRWVLSNIGAAWGLYIGFRVASAIELPGMFGTGIWLAEASAIIGFVAQAAARLILIRIDIDQRWYLVSDRSLRIRDGIVNMKEKTMTFANIQNVRIEQGPLQRFFGIADVQVRTAGGGGGASASNSEHDQAGGKDMHIGYFRGVDQPETIRDAILERLRRYEDAGLGDPDDVVLLQPNNMIEAAHSLLEEAAALRKLAPVL